MKYISSTTLGYLDKYCPAALGNLFDNVPYDRSQFQAGIAAHAVLQAVSDAEKYPEDEHSLRRLADAVVEELTAHGRAFRGIQEPPMKPSSALEGAQIAVDWMTYGGVVPEGSAEPLLFGDIGGTKVDAIVDLVYDDEQGEEEWTQRLRVVRDYKSAWPTGENELTTIQRKIQSVLLAGTTDPGLYDGIRAEVVNLRTGATYARTFLYSEEQDMMDLSRYSDEIALQARALDEMDDYPIVPGAHCGACPWAATCDGPTSLYGGDEVARYLAAKAELDALAPLLRQRAKVAPVKCAGGKIEYVRKVSAFASDDAPDLLLHAWGEPEDEGVRSSVVGLLAALKLGSGNVRSALAKIYPLRGVDKDTKAAHKLERADAEELMLAEAVGSEFTVVVGDGDG